MQFQQCRKGPFAKVPSINDVATCMTPSLPWLFFISFGLITSFLIKFKYSEKAIKIWRKSPNLTWNFKKSVEISSYFGGLLRIEELCLSCLLLPAFESFWSYQKLRRLFLKTRYILLPTFKAFYDFKDYVDFAHNNLLPIFISFHRLWGVNPPSEEVSFMDGYKGIDWFTKALGLSNAKIATRPLEQRPTSSIICTLILARSHSFAR